jgi:sugar O-acyltransferase (sialic acid O-acetyltransferase NeuD family)
MMNIVLVGASGHGKVVLDALHEQNKYRMLGWLDKNLPAGTNFCGYPVLGSEENLIRILLEIKIEGFVVAIGDNLLRSSVFNLLLKTKPDLVSATIIHPKAIVSKQASIAEGTVIMAGAIVNAGVNIGRGALINTAASVDHDCVVHEFSSLAPRTTLAGNCTIGRLSTVGIGATLVQNITIGSNTVVGAASLVNKDLPANCVAWGVPAKVQRSH